MKATTSNSKPHNGTGHHSIPKGFPVPDACDWGPASCVQPTAHLLGGAGSIEEALAKKRRERAYE